MNSTGEPAVFPPGVQRVMGTEHEYGVLRPGFPHANAMQLSGLVVSTYAHSLGLKSHQEVWDYHSENPLDDARGFTQTRESADESQLTDLLDPTVANAVLPNGARLYVDHAHPEYSTPEVTTPQDALIWDAAGELIAQEIMQELERDPAGPVVLYKNNTDGKGASYGTHENYLLSRQIPFKKIVTAITPWFIARHLFTGAGRVGIGTNSNHPGFQISSRADFFEQPVGLETTFRRPLVNTRDEPHANSQKYRRLHVITGDANQLHGSMLLKMGGTSLILGLIENDVLTPQEISQIECADPVAANRAVSHDLTLKTPLALATGGVTTAIKILAIYRQAIDRWLRPHPIDAETAQVLELWDEITAALSAENQPNLPALAPWIDWAAKLQLLQSFAARHKLPEDDIRLQALDLHWADLRPEKNLVRTLRNAGRIRDLIPAEKIAAAVQNPPAHTRAHLRGWLVQHFPTALRSAGWDNLVLADASGHATRIGLPEPTDWDARKTAQFLTTSMSIPTIVETLQTHSNS